MPNHANAKAVRRTHTKLRRLRRDVRFHHEYVTARIQGLVHQLDAVRNQYAHAVQRIRELESHNNLG